MATVELLVKGLPLKKYYSYDKQIFVVAHPGEQYAILITLAPSEPPCYIELIIDGRETQYMNLCRRKITFTHIRINDDNTSKLYFKTIHIIDNEEVLDPLQMGTIIV